jgi:ankyrin repeat protein
MGGEEWDYTAVPVATFTWEIPASGEQHFLHVRVNAGGLSWGGETTNPIYGGGYTIGPQSFDAFFSEGPPASVASQLAEGELAVLRDHLLRHRRPGPPPPDPNPVDAEGFTPLHRAAAAGDVGEVQRLIAAGARVDALSTDAATTPLHRACERLQAEAVRALIAAGADVRRGNAFRKAPLLLALEAFSMEEAPREAIVAALLEAGAEPSADALSLAAGYGRAPLVKLLLARGADVHALDGFGRTALLAGAHDAAVAALLLEAGADARFTDRWGRTPLHAAVDGGSLASVKMLVAKGADPDAKDNMGNTPRSRAREIKRPDYEEAMGPPKA